jgi:hypothetical protein
MFHTLSVDTFLDRRFSLTCLNFKMETNVSGAGSLIVQILLFSQLK